MFIGTSLLENLTIQVPEEVILQGDKKELLPVFLALYTKASPFYGDDFRTETTIAGLADLIGTLGKGQKRRAQYNRVIEAIEWLEQKGAVRTWDFRKDKPQAMFSYKFCDDLKNAFARDNEKFCYVIIKAKEYYLLRELIMQECEDGRGASTLYRVYMCLRMRYTLWQRTYKDSDGGYLPVWVGALSSISAQLGLSAGTVSNSIAKLHDLGFVVPCYGAIPKGGTTRDKPETIMALVSMCVGQDINKIIWAAQDRYRKKHNRENSRWYPVGMTCQKAVQKKQEEKAAEHTAAVPTDEPVECTELVPAVAREVVPA